MLTPEQSDYKSIYFNDGGWIQFSGSETNTYLDNSFTLQMWVSGAEQNSNDSKTIVSVIEDNNEQVLFGLFINTTINNAIDVYIDGNYVYTIINDDLDWSKIKFNLISITSEETNNGTNHIKIFVNETKEFDNSDFNIQLVNNDLIIGGRVNSSLTQASNFWTGYFDEIRLWNDALTSEEISFHFSTPDKLITSIDNPETNIIEGSYEDPRICNLVGLWRFNYNNPTSNIYDESCLEVNLLSQNADNPTGCSCSDINGVIYTLPGSTVRFSKISL
tara:strand:- start:97 stop:921 length:825 start_codon:yes stop_codon:yes gene_type:complete